MDKLPILKALSLLSLKDLDMISRAANDQISINCEWRGEDPQDIRGMTIASKCAKSHKQSNPTLMKNKVCFHHISLSKCTSLMLFCCHTQ